MLEPYKKRGCPDAPAIFSHWLRADCGRDSLVYECCGGLMNAAAGTINQSHPSQQNC